MTKKYYSLRFERNDAFHKAGEKVFNADNTLRIGQTDTCDVRLDNDSQYEDAVIAVVEKRADDKGWKLIPISPYREHEVRVNGIRVDYVHFLNDGDHIAFEGQRQELTFTIREDDQYTTNEIMTLQKKKTDLPLILWMTALTLLFGFIGLYHFYTCDITDNMIEKAKASVFKIQVDQIQLVSIDKGDTIVHKSFIPKDAISGMAFLTTDSLLVTARHCIEPWLNVSNHIQLDTIDCPREDVKYALTSVTHEIMGDSVEWKTISHCSIYQLVPEKKFLFSVKSSEFQINDSRDQIVEYGDYTHHYFWRSISVRPRRTDMMLGDFAYMHIKAKGSIHVASKKTMKKICSSMSRQIAILGCPETEIDPDQIETAKDELRKFPSFTNGYTSSVISHNGQIKPGFSGGPVLTKLGFRWYVIGIVSVTDRKNDNRCYSVPVTEIERMEKQD